MGVWEGPSTRRAGVGRPTSLGDDLAPVVASLWGGSPRPPYSCADFVRAIRGTLDAGVRCERHSRSLAALLVVSSPPWPGTALGAGADRRTRRLRHRPAARSAEDARSPAATTRDEPAQRRLRPDRRHARRRPRPHADHAAAARPTRAWSSPTRSRRTRCAARPARSSPPASTPRTTACSTTAASTAASRRSTRPRRRARGSATAATAPASSASSSTATTAQRRPARPAGRAGTR